jgi:hypothetical protein
MKKFVMILLVSGCVSAALSAQKIGLSAGMGAHFTADFTTFNLTEDGKKTGSAADYNAHLTGGGFYAFFDATYVEANFGMLFGNANSDKQDGMNDDQRKGMDVTALKVGLFGKYPIPLSGGIVFFPMLGIDGQIALGGKINGYDINDTDRFTDKNREDFKKDFSQFWFKTGVGFDIPVAANLYLRPEFLYGIRVNTDNEKKAMESTKVPAGTPTNPLATKDVKYIDSIVGHGLDIRLAMGYKFK